MDAAEIQALIRDLETDRVERKASYSESDSVKQTVCAYANDLPGHRLPGIVAIGVDDKSGEPVGLTVDDKLLVTLRNIRDNGQIYPFPSSAVLSSHRVSLTVPESIRQLEEIMRGHIETAVSFAGAEREQRRPDVPFGSLQQILWNALIHRNYENTATPVRVSWFEDRVEILSPGGPYGTVTVENFGSPGLADYRNPTLAGLLGQLGYVQRFGVGLEVARRHLQVNGHPPLEIQAEQTFVNVTVRLLS